MSTISIPEKDNNFYANVLKADDNIKILYFIYRLVVIKL